MQHKQATDQIYGAAHHGSHHSSHWPSYGALRRADPSICVDVPGRLDDGVRAQPNSIHEKLVD